MHRNAGIPGSPDVLSGESWGQWDGAVGRAARAMIEKESERRQLTLIELERLRDDVRLSLEHVRDELDRIEGLILIARSRDARRPEQQNGKA